MANVDPIEPTTQQPISDDQELAKVLAGVSQQADDAADAGAGTTFDATAADATAPTVEPPVTDEATVAPAVDLTTPAVEPVTATPAPDLTAGLGTVPSAGGELDQIKQQALSELQPLVDKLDVSPEEKFDTYLLLLRSTDDKALIAPAHDAAKNIADEARRAQALLDIIKEIDFLSGNAQQS